MDQLTTEMAVAMENIFLESYKTSLFMENLQDLRMRLGYLHNFKGSETKTETTTLEMSS